MLQLEYSLGIEQVGLAFATPLVLTTQFEVAMSAIFRTTRVRHLVASGNFACNFIESDAAKLRNRSSEILVHNVRPKADRFEDLRAGVGGHSGHTHLRHHLQNTFAAGLDVVVDSGRLFDRSKAMHVLGNQVFDRFEGQVRIDCPGAEPDQQRHVVHFASVSGLDNKTRHGPLLGAYQMVVHCSCKQQ